MGSGCSSSSSAPSTDGEAVAGRGPYSMDRGPFPHVVASSGFASEKNTHRSALPNEDRCVTEKILRGVYMYSVMDGHKGPMCSDFLADRLHGYIKKQPGMEVLADELRDPRQALIDGYLEADVQFLKDMDAMEKQTVMVDGVEIDISADLRNSGSTACTAIIVGNELYVANVGDSRCVICRSGLSLNLTVDQNCDRVDEKKRVEEAGAMVIRGRVFGDLAVTRSIGDRGFKFTKEEADTKEGDVGYHSPVAYLNDPMHAKPSVIAVPEIEVHTIKPVDEFMVLASDGLFNALSNMEVVTFVHEYFAHPPTPALRAGDDVMLCRAAAAALVDEAVLKKSHHDDITAVVVKLQMKAVGKSFVLAPVSL